MDDNRILFVDLDGTLIKEDLSNLAFISYLRNNPFKAIYHLLVFFFKGKPYLKEKISNDFKVPIKSLTFNQKALEYIKEVKNRHRVVYLISGSHQILVDQIDSHLKIFYESFGTKDNFNMVGKNKIDFINKNLNIYNFDYFGNSKKDLPIWHYCKRIIYTNASKSLKKIIKSSNLEKKEVQEKFN